MYLHSKECMEKNYFVTSNDLNATINQSCQMLQYSTKLSKVMVRTNKEWPGSELLQVNNKYLTHNQLVAKVDDIQAEKRSLQLKLMRGDM